MFPLHPPPFYWPEKCLQVVFIIILVCHSSTLFKKKNNVQFIYLCVDQSVYIYLNSMDVFYSNLQAFYPLVVPFIFILAKLFLLQLNYFWWFFKVCFAPRRTLEYIIVTVLKCWVFFLWLCIEADPLPGSMQNQELFLLLWFL